MKFQIYRKENLKGEPPKLDCRDGQLLLLKGQV